MSRTGRTSLAFAAVILIAATAGCSATTGGSTQGTEQSVADACASATSSLESVQSDVLNAQADAQGSQGEAKLQAQIDLYGKVGASVKAAADAVTNASVKSALTTLASSYDKVVTAAGAVMSNPDDAAAIDALQVAGTAVSTSMTAYTTLCSS